MNDFFSTESMEEFWSYEIRVVGLNITAAETQVHT